MPIKNAHEIDYNGCVKILRTYEGWIAQIYQKAGKLDLVPSSENLVDLSNETARPGQPYSNIVFSKDDQMREMKIVFAGDQLTRVRFSGAKDLCRDSHTPSERFEHCSPFKPVMWHTKASLLQYSYHLLYSAESVNENGTLKYFREKYDRKNLTPAKVLDSYEGSEELFISVGKAYIVTAFMNFFGMENADQKPTKHQLPKNIIHAPVSQKNAYLNIVMEEFVTTFILHRYEDTDDDKVRNYGMCMIFLTLLFLQLIDTAREGDGDRNLINQKLLLSVFKSLGTYSKYAIEMFLSIAQMKALLTPRLAKEYKWGFFVNLKGGEGNNIEDDLGQEIYNKFSKKIVHRMGANKSLESIIKISEATGGIKQIVENYDQTAGVHKSSVKHSSCESETDEKKIIQDLLKLKPFTKQKRCHKSFPEIKRSPLRYLNIVEFHQWLRTHQLQLHIPDEE